MIFSDDVSDGELDETIRELTEATDAMRDMEAECRAEVVRLTAEMDQRSMVTKKFERLLAELQAERERRQGGAS